MSHNTWIHRFVRVGVRPLVHTPVAPNHLTTLRLLTGLGASAMFAVGGPAALAWGAGVFVLSVLLDRADGELARQSGKRSAFGHKYDLVTDGLCNALVFIGLGIGLSGGSPLEWRAIPMGVLAGLAVAAILFLTLRLEALRGERAAELGG
ncbi:MAG: CDP-alcohol phosphatidyltransferase family protein, partial [Burkholderiales bacterium]